MTRSLVAGLAAAAAAGLLAGCASGNGPAPADGPGGAQQAAGMTITTRAVAGVGTVLTDQSGKTLYTPEQEAQDRIKCMGNCLSFWFPVKADTEAAPQVTGSVTGTFGSIQRPDGGRQLTYNGKPLYTFRLDSVPGQAHGNDFTDKFGGQTFLWHAVIASGAAPAPSQPGAPSGYGSNQGAGY